MPGRGWRCVSAPPGARGPGPRGRRRHRWRRSRGWGRSRSCGRWRYNRAGHCRRGRRLSLDRSGQSRLQGAGALTCRRSDVQRSYHATSVRRASVVPRELRRACRAWRACRERLRTRRRRECRAEDPSVPRRRAWRPFVPLISVTMACRRFVAKPAGEPHFEDPRGPRFGTLEHPCVQSALGP